MDSEKPSPEYSRSNHMASAFLRSCGAQRALAISTPHPRPNPPPSSENKFKQTTGATFEGKSLRNRKGPCGLIVPSGSSLSVE